ncbi:hypothetical protein L596_029672 [Steinernema carpocapsae]|uniref:C-type lectin domain-containing protein n=1 Tax=Steinernema carpocapsae TaxID=34508 RepID=A0A4U5LVA7_STECR|nr:hypothetical protein L596_029672 [Steinernema carpocapsae]
MLCVDPLNNAKTQNDIWNVCTAMMTQPVTIEDETQDAAFFTALKASTDLSTNHTTLIELHVPEDASFDQTDVEKNFIWVDGSRATYQNWMKDQQANEKKRLICRGVTFQYSQIDRQLHGHPSKGDFPEVTSEGDCAKVALKANASGLVISPGTNGMWKCRPMDVTGFSEHPETKDRFFLAGLRGVNTCTGVKMSVEVMLHEYEKCGHNTVICQNLKNLKSYCDEHFNNDLLNCKKATCELNQQLSGRFCCPVNFVYMDAFQTCIAVLPVENWNTDDDIWDVCRSRNSDPVTIQNEAQNEALSMTLTGLENADSVIGLHIPADSTVALDNFQWVDGSEAVYRNFSDIVSEEEGTTMVLLVGYEQNWVNAKLDGDESLCEIISCQITCSAKIGGLSDD